MSKFQSILKGLLATVYAMPNEEVAELIEKSDEEINESEVLSTLKKKDKDRVATLGQTRFDDGYKKAEAKEKAKFEKLIKEKLEIESDKQGEELIDEVAEAIKAKPAAGKEKPAPTTDEEVKKHPAFLQMETVYKKQISDQKKAYEDQIKAKETEYSKKEVFGKVKQKAFELFEGAKPILSKDPAKANNLKSIFANELAGYDYEFVNDEIIASKDGKMVEDEHGHRVTFDKLVKSTADKYFDFEVAESRSTPAGGQAQKHEQQQQQSGNTGNNNKPSYNGPFPTSQAQYEKLMNEAPDLTARKAIHTAWETKLAGEAQ